MPVTSQAVAMESRVGRLRPVHRRAHARRPKAWIEERSGPLAYAQAEDVLAWARAKGPIELSAAELGVALDPMPWSFWMVLRLGEAMLALGVIGLGWGIWQSVAALGGRLAMTLGA